MSVLVVGSDQCVKKRTQPSEVTARLCRASFARSVRTNLDYDYEAATRRRHGHATAVREARKIDRGFVPTALNDYGGYCSRLKATMKYQAVRRATRSRDALRVHLRGVTTCSLVRPK